MNRSTNSHIAQKASRPHGLSSTSVAALVPAQEVVAAVAAGATAGTAAALGRACPGAAR